jgi:serine acetyltransferase
MTLGNTGYDDPLGAPRVGNRVQFGAGAKIVGRLTIGDDVIIGANAVVIDDVAPRTTVGGVPARVLRRAQEPPTPDIPAYRDAGFQERDESIRRTSSEALRNE